MFHPPVAVAIWAQVGAEKFLISLDRAWQGSARTTCGKTFKVIHWGQAIGHKKGIGLTHGNLGARVIAQR